jgi:hypothetical protein
MEDINIFVSGLIDLGQVSPKSIRKVRCSS